MATPSLPGEREPGGIILFDGVCNLCNGAVNFVIDRDPEGYFKFAALQSDFARSLLAQHGRPGEVLQTIVLLEQGRIYERSGAALRIARRLSGGWPLFYGFIVVPEFIRDRMYDLIAENRYRWFGKEDSCRLPTPELRARFLAPDAP